MFLRAARSFNLLTRPVFLRGSFVASHFAKPVLNTLLPGHFTVRPFALTARRSSSLPEAAQAVEPRLSLTFTCGVETCGHRSTHQFTKRAYERGLVIIQCPSCKNRCELPFFREASADITPEGT